MRSIRVLGTLCREGRAKGPSVAVQMSLLKMGGPQRGIPSEAGPQGAHLPSRLHLLLQPYSHQNYHKPPVTAQDRSSSSNHNQCPTKTLWVISYETIPIALHESSPGLAPEQLDTVVFAVRQLIDLPHTSIDSVFLH